VVHFLEPVATQRTAYEALRTLLDDPYLTIEVLRHACDELETLQSDADGFALRMLRVRAGCEMGSSQLDSEEVLRQVQVGVTLLRSLVEDLEAKVGLSRRLSRANKRGRTHE
jgi:hypothetical protein